MNLKNLRESHKITMDELAKRTGIAKRTLEDIQVRKDCKLSQAVKIAKALDISLTELYEVK